MIPLLKKHVARNYASFGAPVKMMEQKHVIKNSDKYEILRKRDRLHIKKSDY